jgi:protein tyrosine phosphatase (PTP) superfamily phosphohydrolase (DUF442 family)
MPKLLIGFLLLALGLALTVLAVRGAADEAPDPAGAPAPAATLPPGEPPMPLHRFAKVGEKLYRSEQPVTDADFAALAARGIKVIVSVDGSKPDVELARKHGLRYVHIPIGYDGIPPAKAAVIAKVVTTLEGPFLFHCHHGKHRGPAACALAKRVMYGTDAASAVDLMKEAGTSEKYDGLYRDVKAFAGVDPAVLAAIPAEFPEAVVPQGLVRSMVEMDHTWDRVKGIKEAGWKATDDHPDVSPSHETVILAEALREMLRLEEVAKKSEEFRTRMAEAEKAAWDLAGVLDEPAPDAARAADAFGRIERSCAACHKEFRDHRPGP